MYRIGEQLGINAESLRSWVTQAEIDEGARPGTTAGDATRASELERENRELRRADAILRKASATSRRSSPPLPLIIEYIERYKDVFGAEPIYTSAHTPTYT